MMKIDRHNYEELFILYWDDELTAAEKQAVENFVTQNADLREEFDLLGEARFTPEAGVQFREKDFLVNSSFINITNYEEQLLNYIDDEITAKERKEVEKFVSQNPDAQKDLALFQKTKLQPEAEISFPGKSVLYRRVEKVRVISMTWFRVAVAAAIIVIAGLTVLQFVSTGKNGNNTGVASVDPSKKNPVNNAEKDLKESTTQNPNSNTSKADDKTTIVQPKENPADKTKSPIEQNTIARTSTNELRNKNNLPQPRKDIITNNQNETTDGVIADNNYPPLKRVSDEAQKNKSIAIEASLTKIDVTNNLMPPLYIPEQEAKEKDGGGLKELLRKTTRVFERRTKMQTTTEDNKLLVGAFAVSLK